MFTCASCSTSFHSVELVYCARSKRKPAELTQLLRDGFINKNGFNSRKQNPTFVSIRQTHTHTTHQTLKHKTWTQGPLKYLGLHLAQINLDTTLTDRTY